MQTQCLSLTLASGHSLFIPIIYCKKKKKKKPTVRLRACAICQPSGLETQCRRNCRSTPSATPTLSIPGASFPSQASSVKVLARFESWNFRGRHRMLATLASVLEVVTTCVSMRSGRGRQKRCKAVETSPIFLSSCVRACVCVLLFLRAVFLWVPVL